jgi:glutathione S-transferase
LGLDFPNLPYLIRGDFKITESMAIANYIIRASKHPELLGKTVEDQGKLEMLMFMFEDIYDTTLKIFFSRNHETDRIKIYDSKVKAKI